MSLENAAPERPFQNAATDNGGVTANLGSEPVKRRGPGRPRKDGSDAPRAPSITPVPASSAAPRNKPGRKPKKAVVTAEQKTALGKQLCGLHMVASLAFGIPELVIQPQEGDMLADAVVAVADEYGLALAGKTGAAIQLLGTAAMIYLPRFFAMQNRIKSGNVNGAQSAPTQTDDGNGSNNPAIN